MNTYQRETDVIGVTHTVRVSCDCDTCKVNAAKVGASFPLVAWMTEQGAATLKITARNADKASKVHGVVYMAHHPVLGRAQRGALAG
jgi:hypothetical protein